MILPPRVSGGSGSGSRREDRLDERRRRRTPSEGGLSSIRSARNGLLKGFGATASSSEALSLDERARDDPLRDDLLLEDWPLEERRRRWGLCSGGSSDDMVNLCR
jgi:hypothetical protein